MKFVEFYFDLKQFSAQSSDVLIAQLFDLGFDSFENLDGYLKAYILNKKVNNVINTAHTTRSRGVMTIHAPRPVAF